MEQAFRERHLPFEACFNFRDIGGYTTVDGRSIKWGRYFRAGRQDRMTSADLARARALDIRTQIDLRRPDEIDDQGRGPFADMGASYVNLAVIPAGGSEQLSRIVGDTGISGKRYLGYLEFGPETWLRLFELFAAADAHPIVIHCTAGKDRTGVSTAFLLAVLGVDRATIEMDYRMTNLDVDRQVSFIERTQGLPAGMSRDMLARAAGVPERAISDFLDGLEARHGGAVEYLKSIGVSENTMESVRRAFLDA
ncbi:MAG: tyrosine-protein phosphatase [Pseudomonadota bacterium]